MLVLITSWLITSPSFSASDDAQLTLGDKISIYSDKAYRKNGGKYFEAVGNVVIISQKDTVYGELASLDQETMMVKMEGNVRFITKDMTLYGSHVEYNITTGGAVIKNARIITSDFNLVASELIRVNENEYIAREAEFTTCKDCAETWSIFGKVIKLQVGKFVQIRHGLAKIKGVNVLYIPYIVLPILTKRKTGLLVPEISSRLGEGLAYEQPFFYAPDDHKDMTFGPTFWAKRGYGLDYQYRQRFRDMKWVEFNSRTLNDTIYEPGKTNVSESGEEFFRYFVEAETHQQFTSDLNAHARYTGTRDLDIVRDHFQFTQPKTTTSDFGFNGHLNWRQDLFTLGVEGQYLRNQLTDDAIKFDTSYVQTMPRLTLSSTPYTVFQSKIPMLEHIAVGVDSSLTRFRQVKDEESQFLRNADRLSTQPYIMWHFLTLGPVSVKSRYTFDQQNYHFENDDEASAGKNAGLMQSEVSFTMDKIFGLAFEEKIPVKYISQDELKKLREKNEQGLTPIQTTEKENRLVGDLPAFESELSKENIVQMKNSYRHSQEFKFIHHYITSENEFGNKRFLAQIQADKQNPTSSNQSGLFDFEDAKRSEEFLFGANTTRTLIPPQNTAELQWNNTLIRKAPKSFSYLDDDKYLRDNFTYSRIGHFNVSQGYLLNNVDAEDFRERLTRLNVEMGYVANRWSFNISEYYFHFQSRNILSANANRRFDFMNLFTQFTNDELSQSRLKTLAFGGQIRPTDVLGFAMVKDVDLNAKKDIRTIYSIDIMPNNNCMILNFNYREVIGGSRTSMNLIFNFGDDNVERYRNDYFASRRVL